MSLFGKKKTKENNDEILEPLEDPSVQKRSASLPGGTDSQSGKRKKTFFSFLQTTPIYEEENDLPKRKPRSASTIFGLGTKKEEKSKDPLEAIRKTSGSLGFMENHFQEIENETESVHHKKKRSGTLGLILDLTGVPNNSADEKGFKSPNMKSPPTLKSPKQEEFKSPKGNGWKIISPKAFEAIQIPFSRFDDHLFISLRYLKNDSLLFPKMKVNEENPFPSCSEFVFAFEQNQGSFERELEFSNILFNQIQTTENLFNVKKEKVNLEDVVKLIPTTNNKTYKKKNIHTADALLVHFVDHFIFKKVNSFDEKSIETNDEILFIFEERFENSKKLFKEGENNKDLELFEEVPFLPNPKDLMLTEENLKPRDLNQIRKQQEQIEKKYESKKQQQISNTVDSSIAPIINSFCDHKILVKIEEIDFISVNEELLLIISNTLMLKELYSNGEPNFINSYF
eukprot:gene3323-5762_t